MVDLVAGIGLLLLACTALYITPRTAVLGAILLTGYLGGAAAIHVIARSGIFPTAFAIGFGVLVWGGTHSARPSPGAVDFPAAVIGQTRRTEAMLREPITLRLSFNPV